MAGPWEKYAPPMTQRLKGLLQSPDDTADTRAEKGWQSLIEDKPAQGDEIYPDYNSPVDWLAGGIGSKLGSAISKDAGEIVGNEIGSVGFKLKLPNGLDTQVIKNPSVIQAKNLMKKSKSGVVRGFIDPEDNLHIWDAFDLGHGDFMDQMGIPHTSDNYSGAVSFYNTSQAEDYARRFSNKSLDMSEAARMARAKEMGFTRDAYHGTGANIERFDPELLGANTTGPSKGLGFHFSSDPELANTYASEVTPTYLHKAVANEDKAIDTYIAHRSEAINKYGKDNTSWPDNLKKSENNLMADTVEAGDSLKRLQNRFQRENVDPTQLGNNSIPVKLKTQKPYVIDLEGNQIDYQAAQEAKQAKDSGQYDSVIFKNAYDAPGQFKTGQKPSDVVVVFEPSQIRSKFAAFDPKKSGSGNISSGVAGLGLGTAALLGSGAEAHAQGENMPKGPWEKYSPSPQEEETGPWSKYGSGPNQTKQGPSFGNKIQAAAEGAGNYALAGNLPRVQAAIQSITPDPNREVNEKLKAQGVKITEPDWNDPVTARDQNSARNDQQAKDMPGYYYGGMATEAALTYPLMKGLMGKTGAAGNPALAGTKFADPNYLRLIPAAESAPGLLPSLAKSGAVAGGLGFVQNPGDTPGQESGPQIPERLKNAVASAITMGGLMGAGRGVQSGLQAAQATPQLVEALAQKIGGSKLSSLLGEHGTAAAGALLGSLGGDKNPGQRIEGAVKGLLAGKAASLGSKYLYEPVVAPLAAAAVKYGAGVPAGLLSGAASGIENLVGETVASPAFSATATNLTQPLREKKKK